MATTPKKSKPRTPQQRMASRRERLRAQGLRPVLDNDYEIKPCAPDPQEDPDQNEADAEREAEAYLDFLVNS